MSVLLAAVATLFSAWLLTNLIGALLVGALARAILPGKDKVGWFLTIALGFAGGIVGKVVAFIIGWRELGIVGGFVVSVLGASLLLVAHRLWRAGQSKGAADAPRA